MAISSALPVLMGGFMKKASSGGGASEIMNALEDQDQGILDNLGDILGGANPSGLMDAGAGILKMLFGGGLASVLDLLTKSTDLGGKSLTSLLSLLAPIVMSILKRQTASGGRDAVGLANLLAAQKDYIAEALPEGFAAALGLSGLTSGATAAAGQVTDVASSAVSSAAGGRREATNSAAAAGDSLLGKLLPLIALVALALIAWQVFRGGDDQQTPADGEETLAVEIEAAAPSEELRLSGPLTEGDEGAEEE